MRVDFPGFEYIYFFLFLVKTHSEQVRTRFDSNERSFLDIISVIRWNLHGIFFVQPTKVKLSLVVIAVHRPRKSMRRTLPTSAVSARSYKIAASYISTIRSLHRRGCIVLRGNEKRNTKRTTTTRRHQPSRRRGYRSFLCSRCWGYEHVSPTPFACCTLWCLRTYVRVVLTYTAFLEKKKKLERKERCFPYILFLSSSSSYFFPRFPETFYFHQMLRDIHFWEILSYRTFLFLVT